MKRLKRVRVAEAVIELLLPSKSLHGDNFDDKSFMICFYRVDNLRDGADFVECSKSALLIQKSFFKASMS